MKRTKFALLSDAVFFTVCAFFISFTLLRYFFKSATTALLISALLSCAACAASLFILLSGRNKALDGSARKREVQTLSLYLSLCGGREIAGLFSAAIPKARACGNHVEDDENYYRFIFRLSPVTCDDVAAFIRLKTSKKKVIYCCDISAEARALCDDFAIKAECTDGAYRLLSKADMLPEGRAKFAAKRQNVFKKIGGRLNKKTYFTLLLCGAFLCAYSFFTFYPLYYVICGCATVALAAALFAVKRNQS